MNVCAVHQLHSPLYKVNTPLGGSIAWKIQHERGFPKTRYAPIRFIGDVDGTSHGAEQADSRH